MLQLRSYAYEVYLPPVEGALRRGGMVSLHCLGSIRWKREGSPKQGQESSLTEPNGT